MNVSVRIRPFVPFRGWVPSSHATYKPNTYDGVMSASQDPMVESHDRIPESCALEVVDHSKINIDLDIFHSLINGGEHMQVVREKLVLLLQSYSLHFYIVLAQVLNATRTQVNYNGKKLH